MMKLENWTIDASILQQPQQEDRLAVSLVGDVTGHPRMEDGDRVTTSPVISIDGRIAATFSGSRYLLGEPSAEYIQFCRMNDLPEPTEEHPLILEGANDG